MFGSALSGQVCTLGIFQNVRAGRHQKSMSPTCSFQPGKRAQRRSGIPARPLGGSSAHTVHKLVLTCGYVAQARHTLITDVGLSGPGDWWWSKTGSDEDAGARKTWTGHSVWGGGSVCLGQGLQARMSWPWLSPSLSLSMDGPRPARAWESEDWR